MFEFAEMLYCPTMVPASAVWFASRIPLSHSRSNAQPSVHLEVPRVFHGETVL